MSAGNDITKFVRSEAGSVLTFWAASLVVFMGLLALTFDFGRMATTQSELQAFADNVALAAAGELDGAADAITRASNAAETLIFDTQTFGNGDKALGGSGDYTLSFYTGLPDNDADDMTPFVTTDPALASFVRVEANPQTVSLGFAAAFASLTGNEQMNDTVAAEAVAGMSKSFCNVTPLMFCLPSVDFDAEAAIGSTMVLRTGGGAAASWGPGAFGFVDPSPNQIELTGPCIGLTGAKLDICLTAATGQRTGCFAKSGVDIGSGQRVGNLQAALNIRFDIFLAGAKNLRSDPNYAPAPNVIKGYKPKGQCIANNPLPSIDSVGLPPDDCIANGSCGRFGDGDWSTGRDNYVNVNYLGIDPHPGAQTRFDYYTAEIAAAGGPFSNLDILASITESGRPTCSPHQSDDPDRRVLVAAGIDCLTNPISGGSANVPVKDFYKIFMVSPIGLDGTLDLIVEFLGPAGGAGGGADGDATFSDVVRLYR